MKTIAGAASFACVNRSRTRDAPMPTIASTNSDADSEKNGTSASPATARASSVLPVPGGPLSRTPCGMRAAELLVPLRVAQEVDDLRQLGFRLVDPGDVGERDPVARRLVAACPRAAERAEHSLHVARAPHQPEEEPDEEDRRAEPDQHALPPGRARVSGCALTTTRLRSSSCESAFVSAKAGISVRKRSDGFDPA